MQKVKGGEESRGRCVEVCGGGGWWWCVCGGVVYLVPQLFQMTTLIYFGPAVDDRLQ